MENLKVGNGWVTWLMAALVIAVVMAQTFLFIRKGWKHAIELGISKEKLKKTVIASISVSILPTLPILLILFTLLPIIGVPVPWLRLSVIGSAPFESLAASMGVTVMGETFSTAGFSKEAFSAALWVMSIGGSVALGFCLIILKPISSAYERMKKSNVTWIALFGTCCMAGVLGAVLAGYTTTLTADIVIIISAASAVILMLLSKKSKALKWLGDFVLPFSMIIGMISAIIIS